MGRSECALQAVAGCTVCMPWGALCMRVHMHMHTHMHTRMHAHAHAHAHMHT